MIVAGMLITFIDLTKYFFSRKYCLLQKKLIIISLIKYFCIESLLIYYS